MVTLVLLGFIAHGLQSDLFERSFAVDLIFPFENGTQYKPYLSTWRHTLLAGGFRSILIFENHSDALHFKRPSWLRNFEVYSLQALNHTLCTHSYSHRGLCGGILFEHLDDLDVSGALKNFGRWVSNNENIYFVDTKSQNAKESTSLLPSHLHFLATTAYLNQSLVRYRSSDRQILLSKSFNSQDKVEVAFTSVSERMPKGPLRSGMIGSLSLANIGVSSRLCRSTFIFLPASLIAKLASNQYEANISSRFTDMLSFALLKVSSDYGRLALTNIREGNITVASNELSDAELAAVTSWPVSGKATTFQRIYETISSFRPNVNLSTSWHPQEVSYCLGKWLPSECFFYDLVMNLEQLTSQIVAEHRPYMKTLVELITTWMSLWNERHSYLSLLHPRALHSSLFLPGKSGNVALITISHNEKNILPIWVRYYSRHFNATDIFICDHKTSDGSIEAFRMNGFNFLELQGSDANYLMPVRFRSTFIRSQVDLLLRAGYSSVLFTDVDELVAANPIFYPQGLRGFLDLFVKSKNEYFRFSGYELCHVAYGNGSIETQEPPLNWSRSILAQRGYYIRDGKYDKPLLVKVPVSWKPGFHMLANAKRNKMVPNDEHNVVMFHLRSMDYNFCLFREEAKANMSMGMDPIELRAGFASHWHKNKNLGKNNVELCRFANCGFHGVLTNSTVFVENTGTITISALDPIWRTVEM